MLRLLLLSFRLPYMKEVGKPAGSRFTWNNLNLLIPSKTLATSIIEHNRICALILSLARIAPLFAVKEHVCIEDFINAWCGKQKRKGSCDWTE